MNPQQETELKGKMTPIIEKMVMNIIKDKPSNVALYMVQWLQKFGGYTSTGLTLDEKQELEQLRVKVKVYRDMDEHSKFNKEKKDDKDKKDDKNNESFSDEDPEDIDPALDNLEATKKKMSVGPRTAVSAEVYGNYQKKEDFTPRVIPKTEQQIQRIKARLLHSFLFGTLESKDFHIVIGAMEEKIFKAGENVIVQGDNGDCIFVLDEGKLECSKKFSKDGESKVVKEYAPGDSFGELALLYNAPRAATVKAIVDSITWSLDRETFNNIVKDAAQKKREHNMAVLKKVEILSTIEQYEIMQISDALKTAVYQKGDYIIKENELGDVFYILEEGECSATKTTEPGKPETVLKNYKEGEYFGERALIKGEPRFANIIVKTETAKVISLDRESFKRLLGPIEDLLKSNIDKYIAPITKLE